MKRVEVDYGAKIEHNGKTCYQQGWNGEGYVFKDEQAFLNNTDDICYIPEHAFDDAKEVEIEGETYYEIERENAYTRKDLEELIKGVEDYEGNPWDIETFFSMLMWEFPETRISESGY